LCWKASNAKINIMKIIKDASGQVGRTSKRLLHEDVIVRGTSPALELEMTYTTTLPDAMSDRRRLVMSVRRSWVTRDDIFRIKGTKFGIFIA
jgi:hypothetical protein